MSRRRVTFDLAPTEHRRNTTYTRRGRPASRCARAGTAPDPLRCPFRSGEGGAAFSHPCHDASTDLCWDAAGVAAVPSMRRPKSGTRGSFVSPLPDEHGAIPTGARLTTSSDAARRAAVRAWAENAGGSARMGNDHPWAVNGTRVTVDFHDGRRREGTLVVKKRRKRSKKPPTASVYFPQDGLFPIDRRIDEVLRVVDDGGGVLYERGAAIAAQSGDGRAARRGDPSLEPRGVRGAARALRRRAGGGRPLSASRRSTPPLRPDPADTAGRRPGSRACGA